MRGAFASHSPAAPRGPPATRWRFLASPGRRTCCLVSPGMGTALLFPSEFYSSEKETRSAYIATWRKSQGTKDPSPDTGTFWGMGTGTQVQRKPELLPWGQGKGVYPETAEAGAAHPLCPPWPRARGCHHPEPGDQGPVPGDGGHGRDRRGMWRRQREAQVGWHRARSRRADPRALPLSRPLPCSCWPPSCSVRSTRRRKGQKGRSPHTEGSAHLGQGLGGGHGTRAALSYSPEGGRAMPPPPCQPVPGLLGTPKSLPLTSAEPSRRLPALGHRLGARGPQGALKDCSSALLPRAALSPPAALLQPHPCSLGPYWPGGGGTALWGGRETKGETENPGSGSGELKRQPWVSGGWQLHFLTSGLQSSSAKWSMLLSFCR